MCHTARHRAILPPPPPPPAAALSLADVGCEASPGCETECVLMLPSHARDRRSIRVRDTEVEESDRRASRRVEARGAVARITALGVGLDRRSRVLIYLPYPLRGEVFVLSGVIGPLIRVAPRCLWWFGGRSPVGTCAWCGSFGLRTGFGGWSV